VKIDLALEPTTDAGKALVAATGPDFQEEAARQIAEIEIQAAWQERKRTIAVLTGVQGLTEDYLRRTLAKAALKARLS
jgi:hypothetical protein